MHAAKIRTLAPESREMLFAQTDNRFRAHNIADPATIPGEPEAIASEDRRARLTIVLFTLAPFVVAGVGSHLIHLLEKLS